MRIPRELIVACFPVCLLVAAGGCGKREATPATTPAASTTAPAASVAPAATVAATPSAAAAKDAVFSLPELDQMVAPIALYPDSLLAQVLMAATYPGDVADAAAWSRQNPKATGDAAVQQVASQPWDPSVQSLVAFPQALATLGQDPAWVQRLGDAFLAQPDDVMDAVQRLRRQAQSAGHLESNKYQTVSVAAAPPDDAPMAAAPMEAAPAGEQVIVIAPSDPQVVYVPSYDPTEVYGTWASPAYPPVYYPPPPMYAAGSALMAGLAFGTGVAITNALWGDLDWGDNDVDINVSSYNNLNVNRNINASDSTWRHNAANRDGVPYRDRNTREQFDRRLPGADTREAYRGDDAKRAQAREQARASMERRGVSSPAAGTRDRPGAGDADRAQARERARSASADNAARQRARDSAGAAAQRDRQAAASRDNARRQQAQRDYRAQGPSTSQSRQAAHRQRATQSGARDNAFQGARQPQQSRAHAQRGQASHAQARQASAGAGRGGASRPAGQPVNRSASAPRQGGGRHR